MQDRVRGVCPKCEAKRSKPWTVEEIASKLQDLIYKRSTYSSDQDFLHEYIELVNAIKKNQTGIENYEEGAETLMQEYEVGMDSEGIFTISYYAECDECGWNWEFITDREAYVP